MNKLNIVEHQRVAATIIMQEDLRRKNYTRIHVLHVNIDPDYRKLNRNRREKLRPVWGAIDSMVFYDIIDIICEEMKNNPYLKKLFIDLYRPLYPDTDKVILELKTNGIIDNKKILSKNNEDFFMYIKFIMGENKECENLPLWSEPISNKRMKYDVFEIVKSGYKEEKFDNTDEPILCSSSYRKYIKRNRQKISELLGCEEAVLSEEICNIFINGLLDEKETICNGTPEMTARIERELILAYHQTGISFFLGMCLDTPAWVKSYKYRPDVNEIIDIYYISKAITAYYATNEGEFNKLTLTREYVTDTPQKDLEEILMLCNMDVIGKMYDALADLYYEGFSWEKYVGKRNSELLISKNKELENQIELYKSQIERMNYEIDFLKIPKNSNINETIRSYVVEINKLSEKIENLQKKIIQQNDIIDTQLELIEYMQEYVEESDKKVDAIYLKNFRFLFAGYFDNYLTELKTMFPNSVFMTSVNKDISNIKVDFIVFAVKYISHSMYYKVKNSSVYTEAPSIMCNSTSINGFLNEMQIGVDQKKE